MMSKSVLKIFIMCLMFSVFGFDRINGEEQNDSFVFTQISEDFFPVTINWQTVTKLKPHSKITYDSVKNLLVEAYKISEIKGKLEGKHCSFISRVFERRNIENFRVFDVDSDGLQDIIYSGNAECQEGDLTIVWFKTLKGYAIKQNVVWNSKVLKIKPEKIPKMSSIMVGCCGSIIDEYYLGNLHHIRRDGIVKTTDKTIRPKHLLKNSEHYIGAQETILRYSPEIIDEYDEALSGIQAHAVFGNILSKFLPGASGIIIGEFVDVHKKHWAYVLLDRQNDELRYHAPFSVNVGWVEIPAEWKK